mmetsp:Transcript_27466/g.63493  ORF Transcript_27466/g.63493 Transcript_27466/m.63493 type:complete len:396 (-) Transcript_27466:94-1281(-)
MGNALDLCDNSDDEAEELPDCPLPDWADSMVYRGHLHSTFILSTVYAPILGGGMTGKANPRLPQVGDRAEVRLPKGAQHLVEGGVVRPLLLGRYGEGFATACVWLGDEDHQGKCIHVTLQPAYMADPALLMDVELQQSPALFGEEPILVTKYIRRNLELLWVQHGFRDTLFRDGGLADRYPDHTWIFSGVSHGATMSQAVALLFALEAQKRFGARAPAIRLISWNGYRWTDHSGRTPMLNLIGDNQVNFVAATQSTHLPFVHGHPLEVNGATIPKWDPTAGFPWTCVNVPGLYLLLIESSRVFPVETLPDVHPAQLPKRWVGLHSARQYMRAVSGMNDLYYHGLTRDPHAEEEHEHDLAALEMEAAPLSHARPGMFMGTTDNRYYPPAPNGAVRP